jgi:hypothetical protein
VDTASAVDKNKDEAVDKVAQEYIQKLVTRMNALKDKTFTNTELNSLPLKINVVNKIISGEKISKEDLKMIKKDKELNHIFILKNSQEQLKEEVINNKCSIM